MQNAETKATPTTKPILQPFVDFKKLDELNDKQYLVMINSLLTFEKGSRITDEAFPIQIDNEKIISRDREYLVGLLKEREVLLRVSSSDNLITNENNLNIPTKDIHKACAAVLIDIDKNPFATQKEKRQATSDIYKQISPILDEHLASVLVYPDPTKVSALFLYAVQQRPEIGDAIINYAYEFLENMDFRVVKDFLNSQKAYAKQINVKVSTITKSVSKINKIIKMQEEKGLVFEDILGKKEMASARRVATNKQLREIIWKGINKDDVNLTITNADDMFKLEQGVINSLARNPKIFRTRTRYSKSELADITRIMNKAANAPRELSPLISQPALSMFESKRLENYLNENDADMNKLKTKLRASRAEEIIKRSNLDRSQKQTLIQNITTHEAIILAANLNDEQKTVLATNINEAKTKILASQLNVEQKQKLIEKISTSEVEILAAELNDEQKKSLHENIDSALNLFIEEQVKINEEEKAEAAGQTAETAEQTANATAKKPGAKGTKGIVIDGNTINTEVGELSAEDIAAATALEAAENTAGVTPTATDGTPVADDKNSTEANDDNVPAEYKVKYTFSEKDEKSGKEKITEVRKYNDNGVLTREYIQERLKQIENNKKFIPKTHIIPMENGKTIKYKDKEACRYIRNYKKIKSELETISEKTRVPINLLPEGNTNFNKHVNKKFDKKIEKLHDKYGYSIYRNLPEGYNVKERLYGKKIGKIVKKCKVEFVSTPINGLPFKPNREFTDKLFKLRKKKKLSYYDLAKIINDMQRAALEPKKNTAGPKDSKPSNSPAIAKSASLSNEKPDPIKLDEFGNPVKVKDNPEDGLGEDEFDVKGVEDPKKINETTAKGIAKVDHEAPAAGTEPKASKRTPAPLKDLSEESHVDIDTITKHSDTATMQEYLREHIAPGTELDLSRVNDPEYIKERVKLHEEQLIQQSKESLDFSDIKNMRMKAGNISKIIAVADEEYGLDSLSQTDFNKQVLEEIEGEVAKQFDNQTYFAKYYNDPKIAYDILLIAAKVGDNEKQALRPILTEVMSNTNTKLLLDIIDNQRELASNQKKPVKELNAARAFARDILIKELGATKDSNATKDSDAVKENEIFVDNSKNEEKQKEVEAEAKLQEEVRAAMTGSRKTTIIPVLSEREYHIQNNDQGMNMR